MQKGKYKGVNVVMEIGKENARHCSSRGAPLRGRDVWLPDVSVGVQSIDTQIDSLINR